MSRWMSLVLLLALGLAGGPALFSQEEPGEPVTAEASAEDPAVESEAEPTEKTATAETEKPRGFRWRVGGSFGVSNGWLTAESKHRRGVMPDEGVVGEFALTASVKTPLKGLRAKARVCWGCHTVELEDAFFEYRADSRLRVRAGRFSLPFGHINERHDQNVRRTVSKPLPYIMGNMVRQREFNLGVLPAPTVDNGIAAGGKFSLFSGGQLSYDAFAVAGLKGFGPDLNFITSRQFRDLNGEPALGGRVGFSVVGSGVSWNFSGSYMWGNYDPGGRRNYQVAALASTLDIGPFSLKWEAVARQTEYANPDNGEDNSFLKYGYWIQADLEVARGVYIVAALDGLFVTDLYLGPNGPGLTQGSNTTDDHNRITRIVGGVGYSPWGGILLKAAAEYWEFSDFQDSWVIQGSIGWAF